MNKLVRRSGSFKCFNYGLEFPIFAELDFETDMKLCSLEKISDTFLTLEYFCKMNRFLWEIADLSLTRSFLFFSYRTEKWNLQICCFQFFHLLISSGNWISPPVDFHLESGWQTAFFNSVFSLRKGERLLCSVWSKITLFKWEQYFRFSVRSAYKTF